MAFRPPVLAFLLVAACSGGNPFGTTVAGGGGSGTDELAVPAAVAEDLRAISYSSAGSGTLAVDLNGLVASGTVAPFVRNASFDVNGYQAFTYQETGLQRSYVAFVATNARNTLLAAAVTDGGQFNRHFGGTTFARVSFYQKPVVTPGVETGQFSYAGGYAGVMTVGTSADPNLPPGLAPVGIYRTEGDTLINANFANSLVNGGIDNRWALDNAGNKVDLTGDGVIDDKDMLPALALVSSPINGSGAFTGNVELFGPPDAPQSAVGTYAGLFGGIGATDVAGVIVIKPFATNSPKEYGVFNLPRCDLAGASPLCVPR